MDITIKLRINEDKINEVVRVTRRSRAELVATLNQIFSEAESIGEVIDDNLEIFDEISFDID